MILELCIVTSLLNNYKTCNDVPWCHFQKVDIKEEMGTKVVKCIEGDVDRHFCRLQLKDKSFVYSIEPCEEVKRLLDGK